jgi:CHAT domain-containing protein
MKSKQRRSRCSLSVAFDLCVQNVTHRVVIFVLIFLLSFIATITPITLSIAQNQIPRESVADALLQQGIDRYQQELFAKAATIWQEAYVQFQEQDDRLGEALTQNYLSLAYQHLDQWSEAEIAINISLNILKELSSLDSEPNYLEVYGKALNTQGEFYWSKSNFPEALKSWQASETFYASAGNLNGVVLTQMNQALSLQTLGLHRQASQAFILDRQAEEILKKTYRALQQNELEIDRSVQASAFLSLGNNLRKLGFLVDQTAQNSSAVSQLPQAFRGEAEIRASVPFFLDHSNPLETAADEAQVPSALKVLQKGLRMAQNTNLEGALWLELGNTQSTIAESMLATLQDDLQYCQESCTQAALNSYQRASARTTSPLLQLQAQVNQVYLLIQSQQFSALPNLFPTIWQLIEQLAPTPSRQTLYAQLNFAHSLACLHQLTQNDSSCLSRVRREKQEIKLVSISLQDLPTWETIAQLITTTASQAQMLEDPVTIAYALGELGKLYELDGRLEDSRILTIQALQELESRTATIAVSDALYRWQWQLGRILGKQGQWDNAVDAYCSTVQTLRGIRGDLLTIDSDLQFSFEDQIEPVYYQLINLLVKTDKTCDPTLDSLTQITAMIQELQRAELENFLRCQAPNLISIDQIPVTPSAIIYPIVLDDRIELITQLFPDHSRSTAQYSHHRVDLKTNEDGVNEFQIVLNQLRIRLSDPTISKNLILTLAEQLYTWLIDPIKTELPPDGTLVFVLNSTLQNIPFSVLYDGDHYLLEKYSIVVTPGSQLPNPVPFQGQTANALMAGISKEAPSFQMAQLPPLQSIDRELKEVQGVMEGNLLENENFTIQALAKQVNIHPRTIVHLATHGQFSSNPNQTFIYAWDQSISAQSLGHILQQPTQNHAQPIELLVLSACETAKDDRRAALGIAGTALRSEIHSVIASLWQVNDGSTAQLMEQFYRVLTQGKISKAEALRQAQLALMKTYRYNSPHFWSPFILVGNWL